MACAPESAAPANRKRGQGRHIAHAHASRGCPAIPAAPKPRPDAGPGARKPAAVRQQSPDGSAAPAAWEKFLAKFNDPIIKILLAAAALSFLIAGFGPFLAQLRYLLGRMTNDHRPSPPRYDDE